MSKVRTICVVGSGDKDFDATSKLAGQAKEIGNLIASLGFNLLTGGGSGVMCYAAEGFCKSPSRIGKSIGILPGTLPDFAFESLGKITSSELKPKDGYPNPWIEIEIRTHLSGKDPKGRDSRNYINIQSADAVVVLPGGKGTQAELEISLSQKKTVFVFLNDEKIGAYSKSDFLKLSGANLIDTLCKLETGLKNLTIINENN